MPLLAGMIPEFSQAVASPTGFKPFTVTGAVGRVALAGRRNARSLSGLFVTADWSPGRGARSRLTRPAADSAIWDWHVSRIRSFA